MPNQAIADTRAAVLEDGVCDLNYVELDFFWYVSYRVAPPL